METRRPAVAGVFYSGDREDLTAEIEGFLQGAAARDPSASGPVPKALIVPHAGYVYSGSIAASAYHLLKSRASEISRVVLLGPSHRVYLRGLATPDADRFDTPLGGIPLDRDSITRALALPQVSVLNAAHELEHSLEVQLPFLQYVLDEFRLVPFSVGEASADEVAEVLDLLWGSDETLIVVSSDLSHYYDYETARRMDSATTRAIESLDPHGLDAESACGRVPVRGLLVEAKKRKMAARTVDLRNSGDTAGSRDRVVGYGAYAFG